MTRKWPRRYTKQVRIWNVFVEHILQSVVKQVLIFQRRRCTMSKVYVIFRGRYEDRIIEAIFSTLQDAETYCTLH